jgi:peptide/nickel transport system substrate-binding protein
LIAESIAGDWQKIGVKMEIQKIDENLIKDQVIAPRKFSVVLYNYLNEADPDPYPFWHSSQSSKDGLNITNYSNKDMDTLLEEARTDNNIEKRKEKYIEFQKKMTDDKPAIYLFSPFFVYIQDKEIKGFDVKTIINLSDRFANISDWYIKDRNKLDF